MDSNQYPGKSREDARKTASEVAPSHVDPTPEHKTASDSRNGVPPVEQRSVLSPSLRLRPETHRAAEDVTSSVNIVQASDKAAPSPERAPQGGPGGDASTTTKPTVQGESDRTDISEKYNYNSWESNDRIYKQASGRLGVPGKVKRRRSRYQQSKISKGTGDDACHLIAARFGATDDARNLSRGNWIANQVGSYKQLENRWASKLEAGTSIEVKVTDVTRKGEDRPFMRRVIWYETSPDGTEKGRRLAFINTHTRQSREKGGIKPKVSEPQTNNVLDLESYRARRKPR